MRSFHLLAGSLPSSSFWHGLVSRLWSIYWVGPHGFIKLEPDWIRPGPLCQWNKKLYKNVRKFFRFGSKGKPAPLISSQNSHFPSSLTRRPPLSVREWRLLSICLSRRIIARSLSSLSISAVHQISKGIFSSLNSSFVIVLLFFFFFNFSYYFFPVIDLHLCLFLRDPESPKGQRHSF